MKQVRKHLTYSNVMSSIAVFLVLGGGVAVAANQLAKNSVGTKQLKKNAVTTAKIKKNAVSTAKIKKNAINTAKIKANAINTAKIKDGAVTGAKLAADSVDASKVPNGALSTAKLSDVQNSPLVRVAATSGATADAAREAAPKQVMFTSGPLSVYAKCYTDTSGPTTYAVTYVATTQAGSVLVGNSDSLYGNPFLDPGTAETDREIYSGSAGADNASGWRSIFQVASPDGSALQGEVAFYAKTGSLPGGNGIYGEGNACIFSGFTVG